MQFETMMKEEMVTVPRDLTGLATEPMTVTDPQVHIVEIGLALTMAMDPILVPDLSQEEIALMIKLKALSMEDTTGLYCSYLTF